jgi:hypothetical protein
VPGRAETAAAGTYCSPIRAGEGQRLLGSILRQIRRSPDSLGEVAAVGQQVVHADLQPLGAGGGNERALVRAIESAWLPKRGEQRGSRFAIGAGELVARHPVTALRQRLLSEHRVEHQILADQMLDEPVHGPVQALSRRRPLVGLDRIDQLADRGERTSESVELDFVVYGHEATSHRWRIYTILLPPSAAAADPSLTGFHLYYIRDNSTPVYLAWVLNDGTLTSANSIPKLFSHELAETLTDADGTGAHVLTGNHERDEIADVCNYLYKTINGHAEQAYWSIIARRCVLPTASASVA